MNNIINTWSAVCRKFALPLCGTFTEGVLWARGRWDSPGEECLRLGPEQGREEDKRWTGMDIARFWGEECGKWVHPDS